MRASILSCALLVGCTSAAPPAEGAPPPASTGTTEEEVPRAEEPATAEPEPRLVVGVERPVRIFGPARRANVAGLRKHAKKDYEGSRALFEDALATEPGHDMARFNLACALSLLGEHQAAATELITVLTHDPQRFRQRVRNDTDLDGLRDSGHWASVKEHLGRAEAGLDYAYAHGVPVMTYRHSKPWASWVTEQQGGTRGLVIGLYVHEDRRFVPLERGGIAAHLDVQRRRIVKIDSVVFEGIVHTMWRSSKIHVVGLEPGTPTFTLDMDHDGPPAVGRPDFWEEEKGANVGFEMGMLIVPTDPGLWVDLKWHTLGGEPYSRNTTLAFSPAGLAKTKDPMPTQGARLAFRYEGLAVYEPPPEGHRVEGKLYHRPGHDSPLLLHKRHDKAAWQTIALTPDSTHAVITSLEQREGPLFEERGVGIQRHVVEAVELATGSTRVLAEGQGVGRTLIGGDGAVYVQSGNAIQRWRSPKAEPEQLPDGLYLAPPLDPLDCGLCG